MPENLITVATFDKITEAHIARATLKSEGIQCFLSDENINEYHSLKNPLYSAMAGNIALQVNEIDAERASEILKQKTQPEADRCPVCKSHNISRAIPRWAIYNYSLLICVVIGFSYMLFPFLYATITFLATTTFILYKLSPFSKRAWECKKCFYQWM